MSDDRFGHCLGEGGCRVWDVLKFVYKYQYVLRV